LSKSPAILKISSHIIKGGIKMNRRWFLLPFVLIVAVMGLSTACTSTSLEDPPWASLASKVALKINIAEDKVFDAFEQAFKDGADVPIEQRERIPKLTEEDVDQIFEWYQNHPEGVTITGLHTIQYFNAEVQLLSAGSRSILNSLAVRVAEILRLEQQSVINAFNQIHRENQDEMHKDGLDKLIEEGVLTKEQVAQYFQWYLTRPDTVAPGRMNAVK
jgi:hypothetical protein